MKLLALLQVILLLLIGQGSETYGGGLRRLFLPIDLVISFITSGSRDAAQAWPDSYAEEETEETEEAGENTPVPAAQDTVTPTPGGTARPTGTPTQTSAPEKETPTPMPGSAGEPTAEPTEPAVVLTSMPTEPAAEPTSVPTASPTPTPRPGGGSTGSGENETGMMGGF